MSLGTFSNILKKPTHLISSRFTRAGLRQGDLLRDRYRVIQVLSQGGWGETYIARDLDRPRNPRCVIKLLKPATEDQSTLDMAEELFNREADTLERLGRHEQIPRLLAYFQFNRNFYLVQEFIDGFPLNSEILPGLQWSESKVVSLLIEVLEILTFVHSEQVIHRDIKPSNLIRRRKDGRLVLIDFGAVKKIREPNAINQTQVDPLTVSIGTRGYMPLEQFAGRPRISSDVYALGIICIQALTGIEAEKLPRSGDDEVLWQNYAQVNIPLAKIINKMIRSHYRDRYQSSEEVLEAIEAAFPGKIEKYRAVSKSNYEDDADDPFQAEDELIIGKYSRGINYFWPFAIAGTSLILLAAFRMNSQRIQNFRNYAQLTHSLEVKDWQAADRETFDLMLGLVGKKSKQKGIFLNEEWDSFFNEESGCQQVEKINALWSKASEEKLGFSAQKRLLYETQKLNPDRPDKAFYDQIEWTNENSSLVEWDYNESANAVRYLEGKEPNFIAPAEGHLPAIMMWEKSENRRKDKRPLIFSKCNL